MEVAWTIGICHIHHCYGNSVAMTTNLIPQYYFGIPLIIVLGKNIPKKLNLRHHCLALHPALLSQNLIDCSTKLKMGSKHGVRRLMHRLINSKDKNF